MGKFYFTFMILLIYTQVFSESSSNDISNMSVQEETTSFAESKKDILNFHQQKIDDHKKVLECLENSVNLESMSYCKHFLEKYVVEKTET